MEAFEYGVLLDVLVSSATTVHAVMTKRDPKAAAAWIGVAWLIPILGAVLYLAVGINRLHRQTGKMQASATRVERCMDDDSWICSDLAERLGPGGGRLAEHARVLDELTGRPLLEGNAVQPLYDGDEAYPAMIEAIEQASTSVTMMSYIFEAAGVGERFIDALAAATERGVEVRVLIDDVGVRYGRPRVHRELRRRGVRVATFLPAFVPHSFTYANLRNHCKVMVVDGRLGFAGGMNIRPDSMLGEHPRHPTRDTHFRVEGPVVAHLQATFARDWSFTTGESLQGPKWFPALGPVGPVLARGITDGPDEDIGRLPFAFLSALNTAQRSIRIVTPYLLPDQPLMWAMQLAAQRGVEVDLVVPEQGNLYLVRWAMWGHFRHVLKHGVRIWLSGDPFDHSKLFVVDGRWACIGSSNWDPRSLRLNFEFNVELYDDELATLLDERAQLLRSQSRPLTVDELRSRPWWLRFRDRTARMLKPYL